MVKSSTRIAVTKRVPWERGKKLAEARISPIIAGMATKKPKSDMTRAQVLIEDIRRLQLRALELMKEAQEIIGEGSVEKSRSRKSKK